MSAQNYSVTIFNAKCTFLFFFAIKCICYDYDMPINDDDGDDYQLYVVTQQPGGTGQRRLFGAHAGSPVWPLLSR